MAKISAWRKWKKDFLAEQGDPDPNNPDINNLPSNEESRTLTGTEGDDRLEAGNGGDTLFGMGGADSMAGSIGHDVLYGGAGRDTMAAGPGHDILFGGNGNDTLDGSFGNDHLYGGRGKDTLNGSYDNDVLRGGRGNDTLEGGWGADRFEFHRYSGEDVITDFLENSSTHIYPDPENEKLSITKQAGPGNHDSQGNYHADWRDKLVFYGKNLDYEDLTIVDSEAGAVITGYGAGASVTLTGISADDLTESDFVFMG